MNNMEEKRREKLIITTRKVYGPGEGFIRIPIEIKERVEEICKNTNKTQKEILSELLDWALDRCEIQ